MTREEESKWREDCRAFMRSLPGYARSGFSTKQAELVYIEARKAAQVEIDGMQADIDCLQAQLDAECQGRVDRDQEIERLKKENSILYRSHNKICEQLEHGEHLDMEWVKSIIQEEVVHPVITSCLKMKDARDQQLKERDELIKEAIPWVVRYYESKSPLRNEWNFIRNWIEKAKKLVGGKCLKQDT